MLLEFAHIAGTEHGAGHLKGFAHGIASISADLVRRLIIAALREAGMTSPQSAYLLRVDLDS